MPDFCASRDATTGERIVVEFDNLIRSVDPMLDPMEMTTWLAPGFIDIQVNGFAGVDYCSPVTPVDEIARSVHAQFACGVTRLFPTIITGSADHMLGSIRNLTRARAELGVEGRAMEGLHIEGPHIAPDDGPRGAHPRFAVRPPDIDEFRRWWDTSEGWIKLTTISPHWPGAAAYIQEVVRTGVVVSIGHTGASAEQIADAVSAGATMSTHLGNGAHSILPRHPNYLWDQLADDRLTASFIVDGIHLPATFLKVALRAKGIERSVLTTDAVMPAGCAPGRFRLGEVEVELHADDRVTLVGENRLAGSSLKMHRGVENLMKLAGLSLAEAITMATRNPARAGRVSARQRGLEPGERADLVEFRLDEDTKRIDIARVWVDGECVYRA